MNGMDTSGAREEHKILFEQFLEEQYLDDIQSLGQSGSRETPSLTVEFGHIEQFDEDIAQDIVEAPDEAFAALIEAVRNFGDEVEEAQEADVRLSGLEDRDDYKVSIRSLRSHHDGEMVSLEGVVKSTSRVLPRVVSVRFVCRDCGTPVTIRQPPSPDNLQYPAVCRGAECTRSSKKWFRPDKGNSMKVDFQKVKLQESPEELRGGESPRSVDVFVSGDIAGEVTPGDRISVTGILRTSQLSGSQVLSQVFEANYIHKEEKGFDEIEITEEDEERIERLSNRDDIAELVVDSIAPSIHGNEKIKRAVALQLFSGVTKKTPDTRVRGDIHVLVVGDPGTGKSEIIESAKEIAPRGVYTVGKGSSAAGLTASAVQDSSMSGEQEWRLEAGAVVLADKGLAAVDELDKMAESDRSALHEALEQQTVSINKAGINTTLKARCSLLGAANPNYGRFDTMEPVGEQIDLEPALISRFDLIYTLTDEPDAEQDKQLAEHILDINSGVSDAEGAKVGTEIEADGGVTVPSTGSSVVRDGTIDHNFLRKYIAYARQNCNPAVSEEMRERVRDFYVDIRNENYDEGGPIPITARAVQSVIRLAEAAARMRLSDTVEAVDVEIAIKSKWQYLIDVGIDPETGEMDADMLEAGTPQSQRERIKSVKDLIDTLCEEGDSDTAEHEEILELADETGMSRDKVEKEIETLNRKGDVLEPRTNEYRTV